REMRQVDETTGLQQADQRSPRIGFGSCFENGEPRRQPAAAPWRKRIDNPSAGKSMAGAVVAQDSAIAVERADRLGEIDLDKTGLTGCYRSSSKQCNAADRIARAEVKVHRQPVAQRRLGISRHVHQEIETARRRVAL